MGETPRAFTLVTGQRLLDGTGTSAVEDAALLIEGGRVVAMGPAADVRAPDGASIERRAYPGATILPGLVDAHTHLVAPGDGTLGDDIAKEDDGILLLQAAKNARTLLLKAQFMETDADATDEDVEKAYVAAIEADPKFSWPHLYLGDLYNEVFLKPVEALNAYRKFLALGGPDPEGTVKKLVE